jgi:hypothetical protein
MHKNGQQKNEQIFCKPVHKRGIKIESTLTEISQIEFKVS